jgi:hypothetical protein
MGHFLNCPITGVLPLIGNKVTGTSQIDRGTGVLPELTGVTGVDPMLIGSGVPILIGIGGLPKSIGKYGISIRFSGEVWQRENNVVTWQGNGELNQVIELMLMINFKWY